MLCHDLAIRVEVVMCNSLVIGAPIVVIIGVIIGVGLMVMSNMGIDYSFPHWIPC